MMRIPTTLKILKGTAQPCRLNPDEPQLAPLERLPAPPRALSPAARRAWCLIGDQALKLRVLTEADLPALRLAAGAQADLWAMEAREVPSTPRNRSRARADLLNALGRFGMTPADRRRVSALPSAPRRPLAKFSTYPGKVDPVHGG